MSRAVIVAAAQMGPVQRDHSRADVVERMLALLHDAHGRGAELVVYPELAMTTFFPRWFFEDEAEVDSWFESEMPSVDTKPLFDEAARLGVGFCLGFAEKTPEGHRYNTQVLVGRRPVAHVHAHGLAHAHVLAHGDRARLLVCAE